MAGLALEESKESVCSWFLFLRAIFSRDVAGDLSNSVQQRELRLSVDAYKSGQFVRESNVDSSQGGAFCLDTVLGDADRFGDDDRGGAPFNYAFIDDVANSLTVQKVPER